MENATSFVPLLRGALLFTEFTGVILSFVAAWRWSDPLLALFITLILAVSANTTFIAVSVRGRYAKKRHGKLAEAFVPIAGVVDCGFAIALLVLHVVNVINADNWGVRNEAVAMYAAFVALIACLIHIVLSFIQMHTFLKNWYGRDVTCPTCYSTFSLNGRGDAIRYKESPKLRSPVANDAGMSEGDRLITPADEEP